MARTSSGLAFALIISVYAAGCSPSPPDYDPGWYEEDTGPNAPSWGDDSPDQGSDTPSQSASQRRLERERELASELACKMLFRCSPRQTESYRFWRARYASEQECTRHWWSDQRDNEEIDAEVLALIESGRLSLDTREMDACLDELEVEISSAEKVCDYASSILNYDRWCLWLEGEVPTGGQCEYDEECAGHDTWCDQGVDACGGTCMRGPTQCDPMCEPGLYCNPVTDRCEPLSSANQSCEQIDCAPGLYCTDDESGQRVCKPIKREGEPCEENNACEIGLLCFQSSTIRVCVRPGEEGQSCEPDSCKFGLVCDEESGRCVSGLPLDAPCEQIGDCNAEAICEFGTCVPFQRPEQAGLLARAGEPCMYVLEASGLMQCARGLYCTEIKQDPEYGVEQGICSTTPAKPGESCIEYYDGACATGMRCERGICERERRAAPGESCEKASCTRSFCGPQQTCITTDPCDTP